MKESLDELFGSIRAAATRLDGVARVTPIHTSMLLDEILGVRAFLKCENLQRTGAFKFRGAYNTISQLSDDQRRRGVLTYSSGNHAQAVAKVSALLGTHATIVMPDNAPRIKREATRGYGAEIIGYDPNSASREQIGIRLAQERGLTLIKPYDDGRIVAGQGTAALELHSQIEDLDYLLTPCGGGGLLSGSAIATKGLGLVCKVVGVEPALADDATRSFKSGTLHTVENPQTIADGTRTPSLGEITFPLVREFVDDMLTVSEESIMRAVKLLVQRTKLVVEPSGALGIAALLEYPDQIKGRVGVVLSGGNVDGETLSLCLRS